MAKDGLLMPIFARLSPKAQVPTFGTVLTGAMSSFIAFAFDIGELSTMISIGTLLAFATVCSSVVVLRYRTDHRPTTVFWLLSLFSLLAVLFSTAAQWWSHTVAYVVMGATGAAMVAVVVHLSRMQSLPVDAAFLCPWVPAVPCLGLFFNLYLICGLEIAAVYRVLFWTTIGYAIYGFYGMSHSALERRHVHSVNAAKGVQYSPTPQTPGTDDRLVGPPTPQLSF